MLRLPEGLPLVRWGTKGLVGVRITVLSDASRLLGRARL